MRVRLVLDDFANIADEYLKDAVIIHCAAYKHIDLCERNKMSCWENNCRNTKNLLQRAIFNKAKDFVFISTDKAVEPASYYGKSKKAIEELIILNKIGKVVRFGNISASNGSVIPLWEKQISEGKPLTITDLKMKRYFITAPKAVSKILKIVEVMEQGQIAIPEMDKPITLKQLRDKVLSMHGVNKDYPCKEIGMRPGEKMCEKLVNDDEVLVKNIKKIGAIYERNLPKVQQVLQVSTLRTFRQVG